MADALRSLLAVACCLLAQQVAALSYCGGIQICTDDEFCCFGRCCHYSILIVGSLLVLAIVVGVCCCCCCYCCANRREGTQVVVLGDQGLPPYTRVS